MLTEKERSRWEFDGEDRGAFVITGIMASGKSTISQLLAERFPKGVHVRGDIYRKMIVSGREEVAPNPSSESLRQLNLRYELAAYTADAYFEAGFNVAVQDIIIGKDLPRFVDMVHSRPLFVVVLSPRPAVIAEREALRQKKGYGEWEIAHLHAILHNETPRIGLWLDSSGMTPEESVEEILARAWTEARVQ